nr:MAG TPA: hypothetical protein [Caudoviricetes sp.]
MSKQEEHNHLDLCLKFLLQQFMHFSNLKLQNFFHHLQNNFSLIIKLKIIYLLHIQLCFLKLNLFLAFSPFFSIPEYLSLLLFDFL